MTRGLRILIGGIIGFFGFTIVLFIVYYAVLPTKPCLSQNSASPQTTCRFYESSIYPDFGSYANGIPGIIAVGSGILFAAVGGAIKNG